MKTDQSSETKPDAVVPAPADAGQLSDAELDGVAGGINPQPLPPMPRRDF